MNIYIELLKLILKYIIAQKKYLFSWANILHDILVSHINLQKLTSPKKKLYAISKTYYSGVESVWALKNKVECCIKYVVSFLIISMYFYLVCYTFPLFLLFNVV